MRKAEIVEKTVTKEDILRRFEQIEFHQDVDIDKYVDVQMNEKIKDQLKEIDNQIEELGQVCDKQYKKSYNMLKNILDKESSKIDSNIKNYISNLREQLVDFKTRLNYDYKGKYKDISRKLDNTVKKLKKNTNEKNNLENKYNILNEDEEFYERQLDNIKDMNIYLKYKLKLLIKEYNRLNNINLGYTQNKYELNGNSNNNLDNYNIDNENISQKKPRKKIIQQNNDNFLITGLHEYEGYEESDNSNPNINNYEDENEYDNQINEIQNNNINSPNKKFSEEQIEKVNQRFNYISQKLLFDIENEKIEYSNLKDVFDKLYVKTNNIYMNILKNTYFEQNINNSSTTGNNNSSQTNNNNQSTLPSIYQSTSSSKNLSKANKKPKEGYMSKKKNKELVIKFLEKEEIKRIIYKMLYDD
jgi:hypothetical protein